MHTHLHRWLQAAAAGGLGESMLNLAKGYSEGVFVPKPTKQAGQEPRGGVDLTAASSSESGMLRRSRLALYWCVCMRACIHALL